MYFRSMFKPKNNKLWISLVGKHDNKVRMTKLENILWHLRWLSMKRLFFFNDRKEFDKWNKFFGIEGIVKDTLHIHIFSSHIIRAILEYIYNKNKHKGEDTKKKKKFLVIAVKLS